MYENFDKTISVLSYIPILGWLIALIMNSDKPSSEKSYNAFHLRQGLGLSVVSFVYSFINDLIIWIPYLGPLADKIIIFSLVGIAVMGLLNAARGESKYLLLFGKQTEVILGNAFE